jgi:hypothetical protein
VFWVRFTGPPASKSIQSLLDKRDLEIEREDILRSIERHRIGIEITDTENKVQIPTNMIRILPTNELQILSPFNHT